MLETTLFAYQDACARSCLTSCLFVANTRLESDRSTIRRQSRRRIQSGVATRHKARMSTLVQHALLGFPHTLSNSSHTVHVSQYTRFRVLFSQKPRSRKIGRRVDHAYLRSHRSSSRFALNPAHVADRYINRRNPRATLSSPRYARPFFSKRACRRKGGVRDTHLGLR